MALSDDDIFRSIRRGALEEVRNLLDAGTDIDETDMYHNYTPLHVAVKYNCVDIVSLLLDRGANIEAQCPNGRTALFYAVLGGLEPIIELLLDYDANVNVRDIFGSTPASMAYQINSHDLIDRIVLRMVDYNEPCEMGMTPIASAVQRNYIYLTKSLIRQGVNVNYITALKTSILYLGCSFSDNNGEMIEVILKGGANPNDLEPNGMTAFHYVLENSDIDVIRLLMKYGACLESKTADGRTALHSAVLNKHLSIIKMLLDKGADINAKTRNRASVLEMSLHSRSIKNFEVIEYILWRGADYSMMASDIMCMPLSFSSKKERIILKRLAVDDYANRLDPKCKAELLQNPSILLFHNQCKAELDKLSQMKVNGGYSLADILINSDESEIVEQTVNCKLPDIFNTSNFPMYAKTYQMIFSNELEETLIRQNAAHCLSEVFDLNSRHHIVIRHILSFLTQSELIHFSPKS